MWCDHACKQLSVSLSLKKKVEQQSRARPSLHVFAGWLKTLPQMAVIELAFWGIYSPGGTDVLLAIRPNSNYWDQP